MKTIYKQDPTIFFTRKFYYKHKLCCRQ